MTERKVHETKKKGVEAAWKVKAITISFRSVCNYTNGEYEKEKNRFDMFNDEMKDRKCR